MDFSQMRMMAAARTTPAPSGSNQVVSEVKDAVSVAKDMAASFREQLPVLLFHLAMAVVVILLGVLLVRLGRLFIDRLVRRRSRTKGIVQRTDTVRSILSSVFGYVMYFLIAAIVLSIFGVETFMDVLRILEEQKDSSDLLVWNTRLYHKLVRNASRKKEQAASEVPDFSDIIGQEGAKRGLEIAAAGGHNVMMVGPPGSGKSTLAKAMPGILPPMNTDESIVTSKIYSVAGMKGSRIGLIRTRPFRAPHYSASLPAIVGGGAGQDIRPGEVTLAQNGILFLDEFGQMPKSVLEALRGPMEDRKVTISRLRSKLEYPASFMLVAASNPCPCGYYGTGDRCRCTPMQRATYLSRLSGPVMDRIDIQLWLSQVDPVKLVNRKKGESSGAVAERVLKARMLQKLRFGDEGIFTNAEMSNRQLERFCALDAGCSEVLERLIEKLGLSARAYSRILKVARTIADLADSKDIRPEYLMEAAGYRFLDRMGQDLD